MKEGQQVKDLINYEKPPKLYLDVYVEVAKTIIDEDNLWILSFCGILGSSTPSLPL